MARFAKCGKIRPTDLILTGIGCNERQGLVPITANTAHPLAMGVRIVASSVGEALAITAVFGNASLFTIFLFTIFATLKPPPPPNQRSDEFPLELKLKVPQTELRTLGQNCEQTLPKFRTNRIMNKRALLIFIREDQTCTDLWATISRHLLPAFPGSQKQWIHTGDVSRNSRTFLMFGLRGPAAILLISRDTCSDSIAKRFRAWFYWVSHNCRAICSKMGYRTDVPV